MVYKWVENFPWCVNVVLSIIILQLLYNLNSIQIYWDAGFLVRIYKACSRVKPTKEISTFLRLWEISASSVKSPISVKNLNLKFIYTWKQRTGKTLHVLFIYKGLYIFKFHNFSFQSTFKSSGLQLDDFTLESLDPLKN